MTRIHFPALLSCLLFTLFLPSLFGQEVDPGDVVKVNTDLVVFDVHVIDQKTKSIVGGLAESDFVITDRGVKQNITYFSYNELPLSIMLLLDVSDSVRPFIRRIREGAQDALGKLKAEDQVAVMAFATDSALLQDFTRNRSLIAEGIGTATTTKRLGPQTVFAAAIDNAAVRLLDSPSRNRSVIIVVTDNAFFTSAHQLQIVTDDLFHSGAVVYGLVVNGTNPYAGLTSSVKAGVGRYVELTGGEIVQANNQDVAEKFALLIEHLRLRYAIGFRPSDKNEDGKFRPVQIKLSPARNNMVVTTRHGYYFRHAKT